MSISSEIASIAVDYDLQEFVRGQSDCVNGVAHLDQNESYNAGYSAQYQAEQIQSRGFN